MTNKNSELLEELGIDPAKFDGKIVTGKIESESKNKVNSKKFGDRSPEDLRLTFGDKFADAYLENLKSEGKT